MKRKFIGITGSPASGKSFYSDLIVQVCRDHYIEAHNIDFDKLAHQIYEDDDYTSHSVKKQLREHFPGVVIDHRYNGQLMIEEVDRKILGDIVFSNPNKLKLLNEIMKEPMKKQFIKSISNKQGLIIINSALLVEHDMINIYDGIVCDMYIVTGTTEELQLERLRERGLTEDKIKKLLSSQLTSSEKYTKMEAGGFQPSYLFTRKDYTYDENVSFVKEWLKTKIFKPDELL